jgi:hypothetical protein
MLIKSNLQAMPLGSAEVTTPNEPAAAAQQLIANPTPAFQVIFVAGLLLHWVQQP